MLEVLNAKRKEVSIEKRQAMIRGRLEERRKETDSLINPNSDTTIKASLSAQISGSPNGRITFICQHLIHKQLMDNENCPLK